jgi:hypothetical protein
MKHKLLFAFFTALAFLAVLRGAYGSTTKSNRPNNLGIEQFYVNPNIYLFAGLACGANGGCSLMKDSQERYYTSVKFQPYNTPEIYEEPVLFCGNVVEQFQNRAGALVITYRRQATTSFRGIGCHELISVFDVPAPKEQ